MMNSKKNILSTNTLFKAIVCLILLFQISNSWAQAPTITSFTPSSGNPGTLLTITGTNMGSPTAFTIGGATAIVVSNTGTSLVGMVMPASATGTISISTAGGTATSSATFTVTATPYPSVQQGNKLVGIGAVGYMTQGTSVSLSADGNTAIVGGSYDNSNAGAAWVYTKSGNTWTSQGNKLVGSDATGNAQQGISVGLSADGNTAIVGGNWDNGEVGAAWVYTRSGSTWTQQGGKLVGTGATGNSWQGFSVSLSADGNTAMVGGAFDNNYAGAAWVYTRSGSTWTQQGDKLVGTGAVGTFVTQGTSISLSADGKTAMVGGNGDNNSTGAAWVYTRSGSTWTQQGSKLVGTGAVGNAQQGFSVALSANGNTAMVGGKVDNNYAGAAWVYTRSGSTWTQQGDKLVGTGVVGTPDYYGGFTGASQGSSVSLSADGNTAIVGGYEDNSFAGATWVYSRSGSTWSQQGSKLVGSGATGTYVKQGSSVSLSADGKTAMVGGPWDNNGAGAAWVYVVGNPTYPSITYDGNSNTGGSVPAASTGEDGATITLASNSGTLVKTGYTFVGWNTAANGTGTSYAIGASYTLSGDVTLYAKWTVIAYTITVTAGAGGSISPITGSVIAGSNNTYTITPETDYLISDVTVDGVLATALTIGSYAAGGTYVFTDVQGNHTISVTFALACTQVTVNTNSTTINASNPSRLLNVITPEANTNYVWSPISDLYTDSDLSIPYVSGASATTVYAAPFSSITYNVVATNTIIACSTSPVSIAVAVDPAITNDICAANSPAGLVSVTSTPTFYLRSLSGATASPEAACVAINKDVWFSAVVPSNGEIHVTTQEHNNATASLNITSALVQIFTATTCSTGLSSVACNAGGAAANMAYAAATGLTPGTTVYIRLARTTANNAAPSQFIRMAVTKGLIWTGATNSDFTNPGNYLGGDATSLTVPSSSSSIIIPTIASGSYPIIVGTQTCHGLEFAATFSNQNPNVTISSGAELRLQASATYPSFINRSGFAVSPKINGTGTLRFNEGGLNTASILCPVRFYGVVAVRNGITVTSSGNMRFENNAVLLSGGVATAVPSQNYNGTVAGNIVYVRSGSLYGGFNYWSSPIASANTDLLLSNYGNNIYQYNNQIAGSPSNTILGWSAITTGTASIPGSGVTMTPGKGYIQTFAGNGTVTFTGAPNQAPLSIPTTVNGSNNFNLLGNPYPAALSYDAFKASNASLGSVYLWSNVGSTIPYSASSYVVMSSLGLAGNSVAGFTAKEIGPAQGFLTNVSSAGNINFSPNHVIPNYPGNTTQFLENNPFSLIRLRLTNPNQISFDALVGFGETGTEGVDFGYDSPRMPSSDVLEVYSLMEDQQYTTQFLPNLETARVVNLGTVMSDPGVHTFELNEFDNFDSSVRVYLEDALTGEFHNMNASSSYSFTNDLSFTGNRFRLHFMAPFAFNATGSCSNDNTGKVIISNPNENYPMSAKIKNLSGEVVAENDSIMTEYIFTSLTPGAYSLEASYDGQDMISNSVNVDAFQAFEDINFVSSSNVVSIDQAIVEFSASESVNAQYTWNFGDGTILTGNSSVTHAFMQPGIYTVTLSIDNSGCVSTSSSEIIVTDVILGMSELANSNEIISFPNPANEQLNIFKSGNESASFEMTDVSGKVVLTVELNNKINNINTAQLAPGVYTGTMTQNDSRKTIRIVIAH